MDAEISSTGKMNFADIVPGATVRLCMLSGAQFLAIKDFIMIVCGTDENVSMKMWETLPKLLKDELRKFRAVRDFGDGSGCEPIIEFVGALKLLHWLPGSKAKYMRTQIIEILKRYYFCHKPDLDDVQPTVAYQHQVKKVRDRRCK
jgi:hypothetical protein